MLLDKCEQKAFLEQVPRIKKEDVQYLAFEGGGGKGILYLGAAQALEELNILPATKTRLQNGQCPIKGMSGASAGAITTFLLSIGMTSQEVEKEFTQKTDDGLTAFEGFMDDLIPGVYKMVKSVSGTTRVGYAVDKLSLADLKMFDKQKNGYFKANVTRFYENLEEAKSEALKQYIVALPIFKSVLGALVSPLTKFLVNTALGFLIVKKYNKGAKILSKDTINDLLSKRFMGTKKDKIGYSVMFDRGLFPAIAVRDYFQKKLKEKIPLAGKPPALFTFKDLYEYNKLKLVFIGTNVTKSTYKIFSVDHTPDFPVVEAVCISMSFPFAFKPTLVDALVHAGKSAAYNEGYQGFYTDGGQLMNIPIHVFNYENQPENAQYEEVIAISKNVIGFGNTTGKDPDVNIFSLLADSDYQAYLKTLKIWDAKTFKEVYDEIRKLMKQDLSCQEPAFAKKDFEDTQFIMASLTHAGALLGTYGQPSEEGQFRVLAEKRRYIELYSYNVGTFNFNPEENLRKFVVKKSKEKVSDYFRL